MRRSALCALVVLSFALAGSAHALSISFDLDFEFSGATAPDGAGPWLTATFDDSFGGANTVRLTMSAGGLIDPAETIKEWYFNFDPLLDASLLTFALVGTPGAVPNNISSGNDSEKADGDGYYDILFDFPPPPGSSAARFTMGETVVYDITYVAPITAASFDYLSSPGGGNGTYSTAAHVQSTGAGNSQSGWIGPVPEPSEALLVAAGLAALALARRRG